MNLRNRQARAKARRKSMALVKKGVPHTPSKWHALSAWKHSQHLTPGQWQSNRRLARFADPGMRLNPSTYGVVQS